MFNVSVCLAWVGVFNACVSPRCAACAQSCLSQEQQPQLKNRKQETLGRQQQPAGVGEGVDL